MDQKKGYVFRNLTAEEVEARVDNVNSSGFTALLYKTARTDAKLFDETFGPMNWQCSYRSIDSKMFCEILVWDENKGVWISKQNVGVESNYEKEKGQASDALKRAGYTWGCGVELYTQPFIWFPLSGIVLPDKPRIDFTVDGFECNAEKQITYVKITARFRDKLKEKKELTYTFGTPSKASKKPAKQQEDESPATVADDKESYVECADCHKPIKDHAPHTSKQLVDGTIRAYGRPLCWECANKAKEAKKKA